MRWEKRSFVEEQSVWRPVRRKVSDVPLLVLAATDLLAITTVLWREDLFLLSWIEITVRPTEIVAPLHVEELFSRELGTLLRCIELRPIGTPTSELVTTMLHDVEGAIARMNGDAD